jgi:hypothetical protein
VVKITKQFQFFKSIEENKITYVIKYFNFLVKDKIRNFSSKLVLDKSQHTLNQRSWFEKFTKANKISFLSNNSELSQDKILKLYSIYDKVIITQNLPKSN